MLQGIKILDFTSLLPGPYATMMLADMGAEVLKIESPHHPDMISEFGTKVNDLSVLYNMLNRNKRVVKLDLKSKEGVNKIQSLLREYDVIIEGFRPGVMKRLGLDYSQVKQINEDIIYCSLSGYGHATTNEKRAGHDINYLALSGFANCITVDESPVLSKIPLADIAAGSLHAVIGILGAIIHRIKVGKGQFIDVSMHDASFSLAFLELLPVLNQQLETDTQEPSLSSEDLFSGQTFYGYYKTLDDRFLSIGSIEPKFYHGLLEALDLEDFNDKDQFDPQIKKRIQDKIRSQPLEHWVNLFAKHDICVEPVLTFKEAISTTQVRERGLIVATYLDDTLFSHIAHPIKYSQFIPEYKLVENN